MNLFIRKLKRAIIRHGIIGMVGVSVEKATGFASRLRPSVRAEIQEHERRAAEFDKEFGVDTAGCIHPTALVMNNPNEVHAVSYGGSDPVRFRSAIEKLPIDYPRFVFIDYGSGKGRAILLATEFPFKKIIGIEFSEELNRIAQKNIGHFKTRMRKCMDIESVCSDAVDYSIPDECLVCYFCNPFDAALMRRVLWNIRTSLLRNPREIFIVYYNPKERRAVDEMDCFRMVDRAEGVLIWRSVIDSRPVSN